MENTKQKLSLKDLQLEFTKGFLNNYNVELVKTAMFFVYDRMQDEINELKSNLENKGIVEKTKKYAIERHRSTNHAYDGQPYEVHLQMVFDTATKFIHLMPEIDGDCVLAACWAHDICEDCRETYNDIKSQTNEQVAELAYALTNEKGKSRSERANDKYYSDMKKVPGAVFIKICDRIANYQYSCGLIANNQSSKMQADISMAKKYEKEMNNFIEKLYREDYKEMFDYINDINKFIN